MLMTEGSSAIANALSRRAVDALALSVKVRRRFRRPDPERHAIGSLRTEFYERVWRDAAESMKGRVRRLEGSLLEIRVGDQRFLVRKNMTSLNDPISSGLAMDKGLVRELLLRKGIPVPEGVACRFDDVAAARSFLSAHGGPCVVKPAKHGIGGQGVTTGISSGPDLVRAMVMARVYDRDLLIEEMVPGDVYRLLYLDGELLDAVLRSPPSVIGDGRATVAQLVARETAERSAGGLEVAQSLLSVDEEARRTLRDQGLDQASVPPAGARVLVTRVTNNNRRTDNRPAMELVCPSLAATCADVVAEVGLRLAGVDVITRDPTKPLDESGGVVLEVNADPGLYYHHMKSDGGVPAARMILERALRAPREGNSRSHQKP